MGIRFAMARSSSFDFSTAKAPWSMITQLIRQGNCPGSVWNSSAQAERTCCMPASIPRHGLAKVASNCLFPAEAQVLAKEALDEKVHSSLHPPLRGRGLQACDSLFHTTHVLQIDMHVGLVPW